MTRLLLVGCGNMAGAMLAGWLAAGEDPARFAVLDPALDAAPDGVALFRAPEEAAGAGHDAILLGFKPQQLRSLAPTLQRLAGPDIAVHSLLGGITLAQVAAAFPAARARVRVMPNLAARIGKSPVILAQQGLSPGEREEVQALYDRLGLAVWQEDEARFDLVTALAGSGPAFVYRFIDALAGAAADLGLDAEEAIRLATVMVEGAASLAAGSDLDPGALADRVASPGGMTREGMDVLDKDDALRRLLAETLRATAAKGAALAREIG
ncbi:pyrroline-5-carboxylate reductase [Erythrobacter sp. HL-111]|uniref:pyrroline-5-carboxylate reductase family protein n=1 Tax=Erythrobacter sp. HL-111 TaxID=1798193 RepID=UPI0006DB5799|nr:pyrroline-5-carboxylate reductase dimerization domain-containing protein [Erythrobacter sp. HL-111]KPP90448.1 MAG: pyrroline-5-carboxylate reductase [Erythrobacteraceae bacterium HL-111]SDT13669.1 pyrroline-5-carboxylate reductase [Erythrobacter sp. HL-111]